MLIRLGLASGCPGPGVAKGLGIDVKDVKAE
jgi:hypothetical protein